MCLKTSYRYEKLKIADRSLTEIFVLMLLRRNTVQNVILMGFNGKQNQQNQKYRSGNAERKEELQRRYGKLSYFKQAAGIR